MKLNNILKENLGKDRLRFNDLTSMQVSVLVRLAKGQLSAETASPREQVTMDELTDYDLLDTFGELTPTGEKAAELGATRGSTERGEAAVKVAAMNRTNKPDDVDALDNEYSGDDMEDVDSGVNFR